MDYVLSSLSLKESLKRDYLRNNLSLKDDDTIRAKLPPNKQAQSDKANRIADELIRRFEAPSFRPFFLRCGWHLSEADIWDIYEKAHNVRIKQPLFWFIRVAKTEIERSVPEAQPVSA